MQIMNDKRKRGLRNKTYKTSNLYAVLLKPGKELQTTTENYWICDYRVRLRHNHNQGCETNENECMEEDNSL